MKLKIPDSLQAEHNELHAELVEATKVEGRIGNAAKAVAELLHPHFLKEEEYALPPLGLLSRLVQGRVTAEMSDVLSMTDRLKAELPRMLEEHQQIVAALGNLAEAAKSEKKDRYDRFTKKLVLHAKNEEEVLYPAAILVGEYLKAKLNR